MALYPLVRPLVFALDAERAHRLTIRALRAVPAGLPAATDPMLAIDVAGIDFPNPVGLAAGFDKDAEVADAMLALWRETGGDPARVIPRLAYPGLDGR